jgi:hypothetical protein
MNSSAKVWNPGVQGNDGEFQLWFHCPGCKCGHAFTISNRGWTWNGSADAPTFTPSLLCNAHDPTTRCHSFVTDGRIQFLSDCHHALAGQTVDIPAWDAKLDGEVVA